MLSFALPLAAGNADAARAFMRELENDRERDYALSEYRNGIVRESWFLQHTPTGDLLIAYIESTDLRRALRALGTSTDPFDVWFKSGIKDLTGVDLAAPDAVPHSERLTCFDASAAKIIPEWG